MLEDLVYDVGMHKGEDTAFYLAKGYRVVGIEADPDLARHCRDRFASAIAAGRVEIVEGAVVPPSDAGRVSITFYKSLGLSVWGTSRPEWRDRNERLGSASQAIEVATVDLSRLFRERGVPVYLKIDIEGADRAALAHLEGLADLPKFVSVEDEKTDFQTLLADLDALVRLGYRKFQAVQQATIPSRRFEGRRLDGEPLDFTFEYGASGSFGDDLAGPWLDRREIEIEYKWIFEMYRIFGNDSPCFTDPEMVRLRKELSRRIGRPLPGWYDTHARRDG